MDADLIKQLILNGESTTVQFKRDVKNIIQISQEIVAFANTKGGQLLIGVDDKTGECVNLEFQDIQRINNILATAASDQVKSPVAISTQTVFIDEKRIILAEIPEGIDKPHTDKDGIIWIKNGSDIRKVVSKEEISRLLQASGNLYAEEKIVQHSDESYVNWDKFQEFYEETYKLEFQKNEGFRYLENIRLAKNGKITIAGALLFGKNHPVLVPQFFVTAIWFWGNSITDTNYRSSENLYGTLDQLYQKSVDFLYSKLNKMMPEGKDFNSLGKLEIPELVLSELIINALIHRDYFINDSVKLFLFDNRIEIISPGRLPNNLTEEQVKRGLRRTRNSILSSFAPYLVKYRGAGSGILRALELYPDFDLYNDVEGDQVKVVIKRPELKRQM